MSSKNPPATAEAVVAALTDDFAALSPQLQRAARFIIDRPRQVGVQSMRQLSAMAEVHPNTLVRLAQALGFDGYEALRERFRDFMVGEGLGAFGDRADWLQSLSEKGGTAELLAEMAGSTADNLEAMWRRQDPGQLNRIADAILAAPKVYVLGVGAAHCLALQFWYVARMAFEQLVPIPRPSSQPIDDLMWLGPDDVVMAITFQPYRAETMTAVRYAKQQGNKVVGVTDSLTSPLAGLADELLVSPTHTPHFFQSQSAVTALLEALTAVLVARAGREVAGKIQAFHETRQSAGLYEESAALAQGSRGGAL